MKNFWKWAKWKFFLIINATIDAVLEERPPELIDDPIKRLDAYHMNMAVEIDQARADIKRVRNSLSLASEDRKAKLKEFLRKKEREVNLKDERFTALWCRIDLLKKSIGAPASFQRLLRRGGGDSDLSEDQEALLDSFRRLESEVEIELDMHVSLPVDSKLRNG